MICLRSLKVSIKQIFITAILYLKAYRLPGNLTNRGFSYLEMWEFLVQWKTAFKYAINSEPKFYRDIFIEIFMQPSHHGIPSKNYFAKQKGHD